MRNSCSPGGRPAVLYFLPGLWGADDYLHNVSDGDIEACRRRCVFRESVPCDIDVFEMSMYIVAEQDLEFPSDPNEGVELYMILRRALRDLVLR